MGSDEAGFAEGGDDEFDAFVEATHERAGRLAWAVTGQEDRAAELLQGAYARVRSRWPLDEAAGLAELRQQLLGLARATPWSDEEPSATEDSARPPVGVSAARARVAGDRLRTRRRVLAGAGGVLLAAGLAAGAWQLGSTLLERDSPSASGSTGLVFDRSITVPLEGRTIELDLLRDQRHELTVVSVRLGDLVLGSLPLRGSQLLVLDTPDAEPGNLAVTVSPRVQWLNLHGELSDPVQATLVDVDEASVGLANVPPGASMEVFVAATRRGGLINSQVGSVFGDRFELRPWWCYVVGSQLVVRTEQELYHARSGGRIMGFEQLALPDGSVVFSLWSSSEPRLEEGSSSVELHNNGTGEWLGLVVPSAGATPRLTFSDWEGVTHTISLDGRR